ncbi:BamA/TamA family outer membrane protein [Limnochorda pilosa]|uniref:Bacterial surface antigen (D15) domain-containing protein n=1 Tax=Limnochorda pilosa TaxID=1555112 RepID=A0A0K2SMB7_LIMPI|nr:BamA/TamA family outer membrane protein [Limnochorda pilosa]BAS28268.1 hypothetical protein LIP_2427 [Limnochorda pilosa]
MDEREVAHVRRTGSAGGPRGLRLFLALWLAAILMVALGGAARAQAPVPVQPIIDADNGVLGAELFAGAGRAELFGGGGYGLFTGSFHYRAGVTLGALRHRLTMAYQDWPGSLVLGREGQTGASLRWTLNPTFGARVTLTGFQGRLWPLEAEGSQGPEVWLLSTEASYRLRLGGPWLLTPGLTSVWGRTLDSGTTFTSHLATARLRRGWTGLQVAGGTARSNGFPGCFWRLGGGGKVPLRGYPSEYRTGEWLLALSLEHRVPLPLDLRLAQLQLAFFADAGDALGPDRRWEDLNLAVGYGTGLVVATALGELHADLAWNTQGELTPAVWLSAPF